MRNLSDTDSDSETSKAVKDLLSQTKDLCLLEQLSAINCASFSADDSILASDLESRFARLKSFPSAPISPPKGQIRSKRFESAGETPISDSPAKGRARSKRFESASETPSPSLSPAAKRSESRDLKGAKKGSSSSSSIGCTFWCSPKKSSSSSSRGGSSRRKKEIREVDWSRGSDFGWSRNEEVLEDLGSFTVEEQMKILKKAMAEQKKISCEARKIVKMAKKASLGKTNNNVEDYDELNSD